MSLRPSLIKLACAVLSLFSNPAAHADIVIRTTDGRTIRVPVDKSQVRSIEFSDDRISTETPPPPTPPASSVSGFQGRWSVTSRAGGSSSSYEMQMAVNGDRASATYGKSAGKVSGVVRGNTFEGYWHQSTSGKRCAAAREGTFYWGRKKLTLVTSDRFEGSWSYCDDAFSGAWVGTRIR